MATVIGHSVLALAVTAVGVSSAYLLGRRALDRWTYGPIVAGRYTFAAEPIVTFFRDPPEPGSWTANGKSWRLRYVRCRYVREPYTGGGANEWTAFGRRA